MISGSFIFAMNETNYDAVDRIESYIRYMKRSGHWYENEVKSFAFRQWAAREILSMIEDNIDYAPLEVIECFIDKMQKFKLINAKNSYVFSEAITVAEDIYSYLLK